MKTAIRLLLATLALGFTAIAAQAQSPAEIMSEKEIAARDAALTKLQARGIITAAEAEHLVQNATRKVGARCDTEIIAKIVNAAVKAKGGNPASLDDTIQFIADKKMIGDTAKLKRGLTQPKFAGAYALAILLRFSSYI